MIEERTIYYDDNGIEACIQSSICQRFVQVTMNHGEKEMVIRLDTDTAKAFAREILRYSYQIEKEEE